MLKKSDRIKITDLMVAEVSRLQDHLDRLSIEPSQNSGDTADISSSLTEERERLLMKEHTLKRIIEFKNALKRVNDPDFGICEETGEPIDLKRLMIVPTTRLSTESAQKLEIMRKKMKP